MNEYNEKKILLQKLTYLFPDEKNRDEVMSVLNEYGKEKHEQEPNRVRLAILKNSDNTIESIKQNTSYAKQDFRDTLAAAEYPNQSKKWSIPDGPDKQKIISKDRLQYEDWLFND